MKILILNGSPRINGNTAAMIGAFAKGAKENGHQVDIIDVCRKKLQDVLPVNIVVRKIPIMNVNVFSKMICRKYIRC